MGKVNIHNRNYVGCEFGCLKVIEVIKPFRDSRDYPKAVCECRGCGKKDVILSIRQLLLGGYKSCGCQKNNSDKTLGKKHFRFKGYKDIRGKTFNLIRNRAIKRGLVFNLDIKYLWDLYEKQNRKCIFTGIPIYFGKIGSQGTTASLDRIDNDKGYLKGNVQWVLKIVNIMKNIIDQRCFVSLCRMVANNMDDSIKTMSEQEIHSRMLELLKQYTTQKNKLRTSN